MTVTIRKAGSDDIPALVELTHAYYAESCHSLHRPWATTTFEDLISMPDAGTVWLAEFDGVPAGHAIFTVRFTMEHGSLSGYIDDLFVKPELRRIGVARMLLASLLAESEDRGCKAMFVDVGQDNQPALNLYENFGLHAPEDGCNFANGVLSRVDD